MTAVIDVQKLTRGFGELTAVDRVSFDVQAGEIFGFLGPNGAGKSTTLRMLTGIIEPTSGAATIRGHDIRTESLAAREHLGIVPEEANVYLDLSVWRNVMLMAELHDVPRRQRVENGRRLLDELGLYDRRKEKARSLSKGLRQRLMLCSALVSEPEILFLDEPTSGLDVHSARLMPTIVRQMNEQSLTVFLTTHNMAEAEEMCHRVGIINGGRIVAIDKPEELRQVMKSHHSVVLCFETEGVDPEQLRSLPGVTDAKSEDAGFLRLYTEAPGHTATQIVRLADTNGWNISEIATCKPNLEDVFLQLTGENDTAK